MFHDSANSMGKRSSFSRRLLDALDPTRDPILMECERKLIGNVTDRYMECSGYASRSTTTATMRYVRDIHKYATSKKRDKDPAWLHGRLVV